MTIQEALNACDSQRPNQYTEANKILWISTLDTKVYEFAARHEGTLPTFNGYTAATDKGTVLLVGQPYSNIYIYWLFAQMDFAANEITRYNNSAAMFETLFDDFKRAYTRAHVPLQPVAYLKLFPAADITDETNPLA